MYYKVLKNNKVIDLLDSLIFVRYDAGRQRLTLCDNKRAEGIVSSDGNTIWHVYGFYPFKQGAFDTVQLLEISSVEYHQLKALNGKTPEEIIDEYTLTLIEEGII